jgi:predicted Ser/Thr protein kinase
MVVRVCDEAWEIIMERDREMAATRVYNERGICPQIYCVFKNGFCMKYIQGRRFEWDAMNEEPIRDVNVFK